MNTLLLLLILFQRSEPVSHGPMTDSETFFFWVLVPAVMAGSILYVWIRWIIYDWQHRK